MYQRKAAVSISHLVLFLQKLKIISPIHLSMHQIGLMHFVLKKKHQLVIFYVRVTS